MSLEDAPVPTLRQFVGRLEVLRSEWAIAATRARRKEVDAGFRTLSAEIRERFGEEGQRAINELLTKHKQRHL